MKMNISKALKEKNRIAGRISKLQKDVQKYNVYEYKKAPDFDSQELLHKLQEEWAYLIELKTRLAVANVGIAHKLVQLTEAKAELSFWERFAPAYKGTESMSRRSYDSEGKSIEVPYVQISAITSKEVSEHIARVQALVESLQDDIDNYNASTLI